MNYRVTSWLMGLLLLAVSFNVLAQTAVIRVVQTVSPESASPGSPVTYQVQVINTGPDDASLVQFQDVLPTELSFVSLSQTSGPAVNCSTPNVGSTGSIDCSLTSLPTGSSLSFDLVAQISGSAAPGNYISNTFSVPSGSTDNEHNTATSNLYVLAAPLADIGVTLSGTTSGAPGTTVTYQIQLFNTGPDAASNVQLNLADLGGNNTLTFTSLQQTDGPTLSCATPQTGASGAVQCTIASLASGAISSLIVNYQIPVSSSSGTFYASQAAISTTTVDANAENDTSVSGFIAALSDIAVNLSAPASVRYDSNYTTSINISNNGPDSALNTSWNFTLPAGTTFVSLTQSGTPTAACTTPSVGAPGRVLCLWTSLPSQAQVQFSLVLHALTSGNLTSSVQGSSDSYDNILLNNASQTLSNMTDVPVQPIPTLSEWAMLLLATLLALMAYRQNMRHTHLAHPKSKHVR